MCKSYLPHLHFFPVFPNPTSPSETIPHCMSYFTAIRLPDMQLVSYEGDKGGTLDISCMTGLDLIIETWLFVSAMILTDKQSASNLTSTLTECDSVWTRIEKMAHFLSRSSFGTNRNQFENYLRKAFFLESTESLETNVWPRSLPIDSRTIIFLYSMHGQCLKTIS